MSQNNNARNIGRLCGAAFACAQIATLFLYPPATSLAESENAAFARRYTLSGSVELSYDQASSTGAGASSTRDFRQLLLLDHRGFVANPNLISYELTGTVSHDQGEGTLTTTLLGESLEVTLLHSLPERWKLKEAYIPHPIWLRFSHDASSYFENTSYGISFMHYAEPKQHVMVVEKTPPPEPDAKDSASDENADLYEDAPTKVAKIVEREREFPIPRSFFDYDHTETKNLGGQATTSDVLSLRSSLSGEHYDYRFLYENQEQSGSYSISKNVLQLEPIYRFYNKESQQRVDFRNLLRFEERNGAQSKEANSSASFLKPFGKDSLSLTGSIGYAGVSSSGGDSTNLLAASAASYVHQFSSRLSNTSELSATFTRTLNENNHFERFGDIVNAELSQLFRGSASVFLGNDSNGLEYGGAVSVATKTRIVTSLTYSYVVATAEEPVTPGAQQTVTLPDQQPSVLPKPLVSEKVATQTVSLRAAGPLASNLTFQTSADFKTAQVPNTGVIGNEQSEGISGNLAWRLARSVLTLGGNYTQVKVENPNMAEGNSTALYATLTKRLPFNLFFNLYNTWTKTSTSGDQNRESTTLETKPSLRWTRGLTTVDGEYSYQRTTGGGSSTENRFFIRLVRRFSALF